MAFKLFGFTIKKTEEEKAKDKAESFVAPTNTDGAVTVETFGAGSYGGHTGTYVDLDGTVKDEFELITRYREMALYPECDYAIDDIVNEAIVLDGEAPPIQLDLSDLDLEDSVKEKIQKAFKKIQKLLNWNDEAYDIFRKWYVDGRLYYHVVLPNNMTDLGGDQVGKLKEGILELRYIDPRQIRKIRVGERQRNEESGAEILKIVEEYFIYNQRGIRYQGSSTLSPVQAQTVEGIKIAKDSVIYVHSGITDKFSSTILSNLHKAIKPLNQLKMMEDALVIYRIARAPERRIFYIDVGNLPKTKAEDYIKSVMNTYRQKMIYDVASGETRDDRRFMTMLEDFWLPRRDGSQGTQIDTLPGGENLGVMDDVEYFQKKLYKSLNVPVSRLDSESGFVLGRSTEITRDEVKFARQINRLRQRFSHLFTSLLEIELLLTGVMNRSEFEEYKELIKFKYATDNYYSEILENEMTRGRLELLSQVDPDAANYTRKYFSVEWVRKHVLKQTEDEQKDLDKQIGKEETKYEHLLPPVPGEEEPLSFDNLGHGPGASEGAEKPGKPSGKPPQSAKPQKPTNKKKE